MKLIAFAVATLALATLSSPLVAQQTSTSPSSTPTPPTSTTDTPPPFPPFERAPSHRWVDVGDHHASRSHHHNAAPDHHRAAPDHHRATSDHHRAAPDRHREKRTHHVAVPERDQAPKLSSKAIRRCHGMTYKQIMRDDSCRALMKHDLGATDHSHRRTAGGNAKHHRTTHRHSAKHRHHD